MASMRKHKIIFNYSSLSTTTHVVSTRSNQPKPPPLSSVIDSSGEAQHLNLLQVMASTHPCLIGQRISLPQFHLLFNSKPPNHDPTTNKRSNLCVSVALPHSFASSTSTRNPRKSSLSCLRRNCAAVDGAETSSSEDKWDWDRWSRHFSEIEEIDGVVSLLKVSIHQLNLIFVRSF